MINIVYNDKYSCILWCFTINITLCSVNLHETIYNVYLCRGVAFAASAVHGQFYTGCVGNEMTS